MTAATLAWAAGLLAGYGVVEPVSLTACAAVAWIGSSRRRERLALAAVAASGVVTGELSSRAARSCRAQLGGEQLVTLAAAASPGALVPAETRCGSRVQLAVTEGRAPAGAVVLARGEPAGRGSSLLLRVELRTQRPPGRLPRWRSALGDGIDARFGEHAPLVRALLIADMRDLSPAVRERFAAAGLSHMLSVSGLHVGLIAVAMALLAQMARLGRRRGDAFVMGVTILYVAVIGAPLPAVRAAAMLGAVSLSVALQRPTSVWAVLAASAIVPLLDPDSATDLGFQLSMVGMVALVASGELASRVEWLRAPGWRGSLARGLVTSLLATMLTSPLVAATFGRISLVAPVTNLLATPIMAVLQPALFLALVLFPAGGAAQFVADATRPLLTAVDLVATWGARLPGSSMTVVSDTAGMLLACAACLAVVLACVVRHWPRMLFAAAACIAVLVWRPLLTQAGGAWTELHMIDVGQGDAMALRTTGGRWVLFDAGRDWRSGDAGRRDVIPYLAARGGAGRLEGFVLSHPHSDHVGGAASVIEALRPAWYVDPAYAGDAPAYRASLVAARAAGTRWRRAVPGDSIVVDDAVISVLAPDSAWADSLRDPNDASVVARIRVGAVSILLAGDAEVAEEAWLVARDAGQLDVDVLKVAHHGSSTSSSAAFLDAVTPRLALVSVGAGNVYRHPSPGVLRALASRGATVLRTDQVGSVVVRTDGVRIEVETGGQRWYVR